MNSKEEYSNKPPDQMFTSDKRAANQKPHLSQGDRWGTRRTFSLAKAARTLAPGRRSAPADSERSRACLWLLGKRAGKKQVPRLGLKSSLGMTSVRFLLIANG